MSNSAIIMLVEDNRMDIELTLDAFKEARLSNRIEVANSGSRALELLDLKMPGIDGFEVLKRIKETPKIKRIPVVVLTSSKEQGDRALSYDIGANSYLVKPVAFSGFIDVVRQIEDYWLTLNVRAPMTEDDSA